MNAGTIGTSGCIGAGAGVAAFLFDVDGVLADTAHLHAAAWRRLAEEAGLPFDAGLCDAFRGRSREASLRQLLGNRRVPPRRFEALLARKNELYLESLRRLGPGDCLPGVRPLLAELRGRGLRLAAVSASRNARAVLDRLGLAHAFDHILDGNEADPNGGDPDRLARAAAALGVSPGRCVVIEDAAPRLEAARRLGMKTIGIGDARRLRAAAFVFESLRGVDAEALLHGLSTTA